ncbi:hypothetical protein MBM_03547 [Drepanopeziza brunnea f. sp. 'multigermtubi' MB_m1]|uniref:Uncharacterized protein n=1 Tax=Marssonina brunnea f. sp. multigermtubi (strain MB_m1) TaxID=1072389 RepID=K1Y0C4_MARBU|nr:uncharacterized protein MBM_03547 [Drepanopeziza brunnea f. sp. 'multigermtubi' MB_m1]EKD18554.1 hypothetical protein MBM_03547 [Drepanopeziza brunnea f. sp. 'multigermtubi' MB_m1]
MDQVIQKSRFCLPGSRAELFESPKTDRVNKHAQTQHAINKEEKDFLKKLQDDISNYEETSELDVPNPEEDKKSCTPLSQPTKNLRLPIPAEVEKLYSRLLTVGSAEHETKFVTFDIESTDTTSREHTKQGEPRSGIEGPQDLLGGGDDEPGTTTGDAEVLVGDNKSRRFKSKLEVSFTNTSTSTNIKHPQDDRILPHAKKSTLSTDTDSPATNHPQDEQPTQADQSPSPPKSSQLLPDPEIRKDNDPRPCQYPRLRRHERLGGDCAAVSRCVFGMASGKKAGDTYEALLIILGDQEAYEWF